MRKKIFTVILICLSTTVFAKSKIFINTDDFQYHKGHIGKWHFIKSRGGLNWLIKVYNSSYKKVRTTNKKIKYSSNLFIPFGDKYIKKLKRKGKTPECCVTNTNKLIWPLGKKFKISSSYGVRHGVLHTGIDLPARRGFPIVAALDGRVTNAKYSGGYGKTIRLEHRNGLVTQYAHMSVMIVKKGDCVKKGQVIGFVGSTGNSTGNHLHFEVIFNDIPLNPIDFLSNYTEK